jgi:hypothetical protein
MRGGGLTSPVTAAAECRVRLRGCEENCGVRLLISQERRGAGGHGAGRPVEPVGNRQVPRRVRVGANVRSVRPGRPRLVTDPAPPAPRLLAQVRRALRRRHYSRRTEEAYVAWVRRPRASNLAGWPEESSTDDVGGGSRMRRNSPPVHRVYGIEALPSDSL